MDNRIDSKLKTLQNKKQKKIEESQSLREKAKEKKEKRNKENQKVSKHKKKREEVNEKITEKKEELEKLREQVDKIKQTVEKSYEHYNRKHNSLYWKYQTEPVSGQKEKETVEKLEELEEKKEKAKKLKEKKQKITKLQKQINNLSTEANIHHEMVVKHAEKSEEAHQEMINTYKGLDEIEEEIDRLKGKIKEHQNRRKRTQTTDKGKKKQFAEQSLKEFKENGKITLNTVN